jgi:hypothetical protein
MQAWSPMSAFMQTAYGTVAPGTKRRYKTFVTHPWIVRSNENGERMMINDSMVGGLIADLSGHLLDLAKNYTWFIVTCNDLSPVATCSGGSVDAAVVLAVVWTLLLCFALLPLALLCFGLLRLSSTFEHFVALDAIWTQARAHLLPGSSYRL